MERKFKMRDFPLFIAAVLCCLSFSSPGMASDTPPAFEYVYPDQSIWTTQRDADGVLKNPLLQVADKLFDSLQLPWSARAYPANRMFERLETGKSNFSILVKASRLKEKCVFSDNPVTYSELRVYRRAGVSPVRSLDDFKGKKVITIRGYSYGKIGKFLKDPVNEVILYEAPLHDSAFAMLRHDRAGYLLDYSGPSEEILTSEPIQGVEHDMLTRLDVFLVLSKQYPEAEKMMGVLEKAVKNIDVTRWGLKQP